VFTSLPDRFAVISDVHGNLLALNAVLADIANRAVSHIVNLGDHLQDRRSRDG
jgi:predicted phosphodiesterase